MMTEQFLIAPFYGNPHIKRIQEEFLRKYDGKVLERQEPSTFHITMVTVDDTQHELGDLVVPSIKDTPVTCKGVGAFETDDGWAVHLKVESPQLRQVQASLYKQCADNGHQMGEFSNPKSWDPHITLAYVEKEPRGMYLTKPFKLTAQTVIHSQGNYETIKEYKRMSKKAPRQRMLDKGFFRNLRNEIDTARQLAMRGKNVLERGGMGNSKAHAALDKAFRMLSTASGQVVGNTRSEKDTKAPPRNFDEVERIMLQAADFATDAFIITDRLERALAKAKRIDPRLNGAYTQIGRANQQLRVAGRNLIPNRNRRSADVDSRVKDILFEAKLSPRARAIRQILVDSLHSIRMAHTHAYNAGQYIEWADRGVRKMSGIYKDNFSQELQALSRGYDSAANSIYQGEAKFDLLENSIDWFEIRAKAPITETRKVKSWMADAVEANQDALAELGEAESELVKLQRSRYPIDGLDGVLNLLNNAKGKLSKLTRGTRMAKAHAYSVDASAQQRFRETPR